MGSVTYVMPPMSYARQLWRYGEPDLAQRAARMTPREAAIVGRRAGYLGVSGQAAQLWPDGPSGRNPALLLAVIEYLEGAPRPAARTRRLPEKSLPAELQNTQEERWEAALLVSRSLDQMGRLDW